nr:E3 ubiquitin-protein ligase RNF213-like [Microcebus murinus]
MGLPALLGPRAPQRAAAGGRTPVTPERARELRARRAQVPSTGRRRPATGKRSQGMVATATRTGAQRLAEPPRGPGSEGVSRELGLEDFRPARADEAGLPARAQWLLVAGGCGMLALACALPSSRHEAAGGSSPGPAPDGRQKRGAGGRSKVRGSRAVSATGHAGTVLAWSIVAGKGHLVFNPHGQDICGPTELGGKESRAKASGLLSLQMVEDRHGPPCPCCAVPAGGGIEPALQKRELKTGQREKLEGLLHFTAFKWSNGSFSVFFFLSRPLDTSNENGLEAALRAEGSAKHGGFTGGPKVKPKWSLVMWQQARSAAGQTRLPAAPAGGMECPSCQHVCKEEAPKFCSQCGHRLPPPVAPVADPGRSDAAAAPEGGLECGEEAKEEGSSCLSPGSGDCPESPDEPCSEAPWTVQQTGKPRNWQAQNWMIRGQERFAQMWKAVTAGLYRRLPRNSADHMLTLRWAEVEDSSSETQRLLGSQRGDVLYPTLEESACRPPWEAWFYPSDGGVLCEAETKDEAAVAGENAAEKERGQGGGPKEPEGNSRGCAAAAKSEKEHSHQSAAPQEVTASPPSPGEGVTVYFHAILSKDFDFNPDRHTLFVRGGGELGQPEWSRRVCELHCTRHLPEEGWLVEGSAVISRRHLDTPIPYKYVVGHDKGSGEYEFIYKVPQRQGEQVNRCLCIKSSLLGAGEWHQYDDIICMRPLEMFQGVLDHVTEERRRSLVKGKQRAATVMLDSIFSVLQTWDAINLNSFFTQFQQFYSVVRAPMIYEGRAQPWSDLRYGEKEVKKDLWEYLKKQMDPFLDGSGDSLPDGRPVRSKLRMGLVVLFSVEKFGLPMSEDDLDLLCRMLVPDSSSPHDLHDDLSHILRTAQRYC